MSDSQPTAIEVFKRATTAIKRHPWYSGGGLLALGTALDWGERLRSGAGMMEQWLGASWIDKVVSSPFFDIAALVLALVCFWRIGILSLREQKATATSETAIRAQALELPIIFIQAEARNRELARFSCEIDKAEASLERFKTESQKFFGPDTVLVRSTPPNAFAPFDAMIFFGLQSARFNFLSPPQWEPVVNERTPTLQSHLGPVVTMDPPREYVPSDNARFIESRRATIAEIEGHINKLRSYESEQRSKMIDLLSVLDRKVSEYGN